MMTRDADERPSFDELLLHQILKEDIERLEITRDDQKAEDEIEPVNPHESIARMLCQLPEGAGLKQTEHWSRLKPLTEEIFDAYWQLVETNKLMTDAEAANFESWTNDFGS